MLGAEIALSLEPANRPGIDIFRLTNQNQDVAKPLRPSKILPRFVITLLRHRDTGLENRCHIICYFRLLGRFRFLHFYFQFRFFLFFFWFGLLDYGRRFRFFLFFFWFGLLNYGRRFRFFLFFFWFGLLDYGRRFRFFLFFFWF